MSAVGDGQNCASGFGTKLPQIYTPAGLGPNTGTEYKKHVYRGKFLINKIKSYHALMIIHPLILYKWDWCMMREHVFYTIDVVY